MSQPHITFPKVVGLRGLAGAGKTSVATRLSLLGTFECLSFADPMRSGFLRMGIAKDTHPGLYREYMQKVGQGVRAVDPDHWVRMQTDAIRRCLERGRHAVFDDVRYPNEVEVCDLVFFVQPEGFEVADLGLYTEHESEQWNRRWVYDSVARIEQTHTVALPNPYNSINTTTQPILDALKRLEGAPSKHHRVPVATA